MSKLNVTNVEVHKSNESGDVALACEYNKARYHVWVNPTDHSNVRPELFKRSIVLNRNEPGFFETRRLHTTTQFGEQLIAAMIDIANANDLWAKAEATYIEMERQRKAATKAAIHLNRIKEAAQDLYEALAALDTDDDGERYCFCQAEQEPSRPDAFHSSKCLAARAALAKAEGK